MSHFYMFETKFTHGQKVYAEEFCGKVSDINIAPGGSVSYNVRAPDGTSDVFYEEELSLEKNIALDV